MIGELVEREAVGAAAALASLDDAAVGSALRRAAQLLEERARDVLASNERDMEAARDELDAGALDRLRLDEQRLATLARQLEATAELEPLEREIASRTLANGLQVRELRIPVGTIGANFEARPGVALDIAAQVLKSLNAIVLRTGGAALRTVEALVDEVLRPALEAEGIDGRAVGLVRSADRSGAQALVSLPKWIPLVILRGSGASTAALERRAADNGVRTLAHAEGGGVLYVHGSARADRVTAIVDASLDRLGVCNRLNLALVDREAAGLAADLVAACEQRGVVVVGTARAAAVVAVGELDEAIGHEWAGDSDRVATVTLDVVDDLAEAVRIANTETSALAAGIVAEDTEAVEAFFSRYRGTAAFWHATTRFTDGFELNGTPETGINVDWAPGPRGPVSYRDLWLRQYRVVGDATQRR
jgi:glutamate-5-semialdehyde dehydrogenase